MTDAEIVKALEESISFDEPYESDFTLIRIEYIKNALALINRQKEEKETMQHYIDHLQEEIESLQRQLHNAKLHQKKTRKMLQDEKALRLNEDFIKSEALKEFAERLLSCYEGFDETNEVILFENLVKAIEDTKREMESE